MKVLWICNVMLPQVAKDLNKAVPFGGGWMAGLANDMTTVEDIELYVCFPCGNFVEGEVEGIRYFGFASKEDLKTAIEKSSADVVHIFGTEHKHSADVTDLCIEMGIREKVVISIQGLVSVYAQHYINGVPKSVEKGQSLRDFIKRSTISKGKRAYEQKGEFEKQAIRNTNHIIGRTDWDYACTRQINPEAIYHFCNETLRGAFYENEWSLDKCEKHSIFVSQCNYPIKGFHKMLEAMPIVLKFYPDAKLYTTGRNVINEKGLKGKLKLTKYEQYLKKLIKKYNLEQNVEFLGALDEQKMCQRYLKSHVFVSPSSIENSPNSVGEAMILGVPTVTSDVGGIKALFNHNVDGFIYQADAPYMLADCIIKIFESNELTKMFSENAKMHAKATHNRENNLKTMLKIYKEIGKTEEK